MNGQNKLYVLALIISICVIIGITIIFSALYALYTVYKRKQIKFGFEDKSILSSFNSDYEKIQKKREKKNLNRLSKKDTYHIVKKGDRRLHGFVDVITSIFIIFFLLVFAVGVSFAATDNSVYINNKTYITILTASMEEKNTKNTYLVDNNLNDQITQYSLISLEKPKSIDDIKLYDVIAFKVKESELSDSIALYGNSYSILSKSYENEKDTYVTFVHRVINIYDGADDHSESTIAGKTYFTTRGDSNTSSFSQETAIEFDDIIGVYTGFSNYYLGVFIIYFKSSIGIIALLSASLFLFLALFAEEKVDKAYNIRLWELICLEEPIQEKKPKVYKQYAYSKALYFNNNRIDESKNSDDNQDRLEKEDSESNPNEVSKEENEDEILNKEKETSLANEKDSLNDIAEFETNVDSSENELIPEEKKSDENKEVVDDSKVEEIVELDGETSNENIEYKDFSINNNDTISYSKAKEANKTND